jgi:hypothetical protein
MMIEAESQLVLSTLAEHSSRKHLKMVEAFEYVHTREEGLLRGQWWPVGSKVMVDQMATLSP